MLARRTSHKYRVQYFFGVLLLLLLLGHVLKFWQLPVLNSLDSYFYDTHVRLNVQEDVDSRVVIVDIDDKSLAELGHWPWGRQVVGEMVRRLVDEGGALVVGFDVVFAERDTSSGLSVLEGLADGPLRHDRQYRETLANLRASLDYDQVFADVLKDRPVVLGYYFSNGGDQQKTGSLPEPVFPRGSFAGLANAFYVWEGYGGNIPVLQEAARTAGHMNPLVDGDGVSRRVPLLVEYDGAYYQALSLAVLRTALGQGTLLPGVPKGGQAAEWLSLLTEQGNLRIPVDGQFSVLIPFRGPAKSFPYVSAVDVLKGRISPEMFRDRVVLVGTTAPGLKDLRSTPVESAYPGVELHANLIAGMLDGTILEQPDYMVFGEALLLLTLGLLLLICLPRLSPLRAGLLLLLAVLFLLGLHYVAWHQAALLLPIASTLSMLLTIFVFDMSWGYLVESRRRRQFTDLFGQYVPPELVQEMARDPESYSMEGRSCELTVLFSDVRSFTTLSEGMSPRELSAMMNEYLGRMTEIIRARRGTLDKYIGDAIMAFWGAPVEDHEHARHAVLAALEMQAAVQALEDEFVTRGWPRLRIGVGVNTGLMTVGDMGSPVRKAYTVLGDAVNLASRLEGITKEYGVGIVVGEATAAQLTDMAFRELDLVKVKGKDKAVAIYEPLGLASALSADQQENLRAWREFLGHYRAQDWSAAAACLENLRRRDEGSHLYQLYEERIVFMRENPPGEGWDGVTVFKTK